MPATNTMYSNDRNMASHDIGSDGNRSAQSLTSSDFISESFRESPKHHQIRDMQIREDSIDTENVREIAMKTPHLVEWHLPPKDVELRSVGNKSFGLNFKLRVIIQTRDGPRDLFLLVDNVTSESPASKILKRGDLILSINRSPTHCTQDEVNTKEFVDSVLKLTKQSDRLQLKIQSPHRRLLPSFKSNRFSRQGSTRCSQPMMIPHEQSVETRSHTRRSARAYDMMSYLQLAERTCQASMLSKVPYSKIIVFGENNAMLAKVLLGFGSNRMTKIESFSKGSFILQNSEESGWERTFQVKSSVVTFKTWLRDPKNLKQCLDSNARRLIEAQLAPTERRYDEFCGEKNPIYIDLFAPVHTDIRVGNLAASLLMTGNEVYVYDIPATHFLQETQVCLKEAQSILSRIRTLAGQRVPVLLVVTYTGKPLDPKVCVAIGEALKRFFTNSIMKQLVSFDNTVPCCFLSLNDLNSEDGSLSTTIERERNLSEEITNFNTPLASLRFKVMQLLWEQNYLPKYCVPFLRYHELFWRMTEQTKAHKYYFKREIKEACCIRSDTDLSDFITYLKSLGELSGETSHVRDNQQIFLRPSSLHSPLTKMLSVTSEKLQHTHLREEWDILEITGIASSFLREIFDDFEECDAISYLQMLGIMYPLSPLAAQRLDTPFPKNRDDSYNLMTTALMSATQCKCFLHDEHSLRIKFSGWIPTGFLVKLVLKMIENLNYPSIRWTVCQSGCYKVNTKTGFRLLFQEDLLSTSIKVSTSFKGMFLPNYLLQLLIKITRELAISEDERPLVGCDCPLVHNKDECQMHVLDLSVEDDRDIICGKQRLNEHPRLIFWLMTANLKDATRRTMPSLHYSRYTDQVSVVAATADSLSNVNPEVYTWLCDKLNVLDNTSRRDWRLVAAKLGFKKEDIDFLDHPRPDWNPCHRLFERWIQTGMATISQLRQLLEEIGRKDIVCELDRNRWSFPNTNRT